MWQSDVSGSRRNNVSEPFRELFQPYVDTQVISGFDFMVRFELLIMFAAAQSQSIPYTIRENWRRFYPEIPDAVETELFGEVIRYIENYRTGMRLISEGQNINRRSIRENAIYPVALLLVINDSAGQIDPDEVCWKTVKLLSGTLSDPDSGTRKLKTRIKDSLMRLSCPLNSKATLLPKTVEILQKHQTTPRRLFDRLYPTLERKRVPNRDSSAPRPDAASTDRNTTPPAVAPSPAVSAAPPPAPVDTQKLPDTPKQAPAETKTDVARVDSPAETKAASPESRNVPRQTPGYDSSYVQTCSPLMFSRVVCLLELCLIKKQEAEKTTGESKRPEGGRVELEPLFKACWSDIFAEPYSQESYKQVYQIIRRNWFLDSISRLFHYPLEELRSDKTLRAIIIARSVNCVLSRIPRRTTVNTLIEESLSLYDEFNVVSIGAEEEDTKSYIRQFQTMDEQLDERVLELFRTYREVIDASIQKTQEGLSKSRTRNRYIEAVKRERDQRINDLQEQVSHSRYHILYELTEMLSSETYGYLLGRFYRIAQGYDTPDERTPALCRDFMQILHYFSIDPIDGDQIGKPYDPDAKKLIIDNFTGITQPGIVFPGWRVADDTVILPVATEIDSGGDE